MKLAAKVASAAIMIALCLGIGMNAGAQNNKKKGAASKGNVTELTTDTFNKVIYDMTQDNPVYLGKKPAIVDFTATWCGPCQRLAPILDELAGEFKGKVEVYKVDVDKCKSLAKAFEISSIPCLLFIPADGQEPQRVVGLRDKATLKKEIETIILGK